jgi:hypothetical protein
VVCLGVIVRPRYNEEALAHWGLLRHKIKYCYCHSMLRCVMLTIGRAGRVRKFGRNVSRRISEMSCRYKLLSLNGYKFRAAQLLLLW